MVKEYIEREALITEIEENINTYWNKGSGGYYLAEDALNYSIKTAPTADVAPIRHGYWIRIDHCDYECSNCGANVIGYKHNYCENCGVRMDGVI